MVSRIVKTLSRIRIKSLTPAFFEGINIDTSGIKDFKYVSCETLVFLKTFHKKHKKVSRLEISLIGIKSHLSTPNLLPKKYLWMILNT